MPQKALWTRGRSIPRIKKKAYSKKSSNVPGPNGLINGPWWFNRMCVLRDGAHGEQEAGIHGQTGKGAFSVVVAAGEYADGDHGEVCLSK